MYEDRTYVLYVCENEKDIFLHDKYYQISICKKYNIVSTYIENTNIDLMERPEFKNALKRVINGRHSLLVYNMNVLGKNALEVVELLDKLDEKSLYITSAENDAYSKYSYARLAMGQEIQINQYNHHIVSQIFLVSTGKNYSGLENTKGVIKNPKAIRLFLNDDLFLEIFSLKTLHIVYKFVCNNSLFENHEKISSDVEELFI